MRGAIQILAFFWPVLLWGGGADNSQIPCPCAKVTDSQYPGPAAQIGQKILVNLSRAKSFDKPGFDLAKFHECQHSIGGGDEQQADALGAKLACKAGYLNEAAVKNICKALGGTKGNGKHPPGPVRCATFKKALEECKAGGGGGGSGGGKGKGDECGGKPLQFAMPEEGEKNRDPNNPTPMQPRPISFMPDPTSPDEENPFKTGDYERIVAKEEAEEQKSGQSSMPALADGRSPNALSDISGRTFDPGKSGGSASDITSSSNSYFPAGGKATELGYGGAAGNGLAEAGKAVGGTNFGGGTAYSETAGLPVVNPSQKKAKAEILSTFKEDALTSPKLMVAASEVANALKAYGLEGAGAGPSPTNKEKDDTSLFERCHAVYQRKAEQLR